MAFRSLDVENKMRTSGNAADLNYHQGTEDDCIIAYVAAIELMSYFLLFELGHKGSALNFFFKVNKN